MGVRRVEVEIQELVLHGFRGLDGAAVADAVEQALRSRLAGADAGLGQSRALDRLRDRRTVDPRESVQDELLDLDLDSPHAHPATSASVSGFSILACSPRAARSTWLMRTGSSASAAKNAAERAMLRIVPPATFS